MSPRKIFEYINWISQIQKKINKIYILIGILLNIIYYTLWTLISTGYSAQPNFLC